MDARMEQSGEWREKTLAQIRAPFKQIDPDGIEAWKWLAVETKMVEKPETTKLGAITLPKSVPWPID